MACYSPLQAYKLLTKKTENGKQLIVFNHKEAKNHPYEKIELPCSQCIGCRIDRSKSWAVRCVHEASLYKDNNCFITLTFNDENINEYRTLVKSDFQKFMKRLRKKYRGVYAVEVDGKITYPIRYFHCGEYGSQLGRPHHHACIFNFRFNDLKLFKYDKETKTHLYTSEELNRLWSKEINEKDIQKYKPENVFFDEKSNTYKTYLGYCTVGEVTFQSAAYIARYIIKKINGDMKEKHYREVDKETGVIIDKQQEYITMSRRPGIAKRYFEQFKGDVFPKDFTTIAGKKFKPPAYYDKLYEEIDPENLKKIKKKRIEKHKKDEYNNSAKRLSERRKLKERQVKRLVRRIENEITDL